ncbi:mechanosensitive ion channel family protein [Aestuariibacter salexigens]|uniref:mechanosensitive ion channel family protein n=1 Tax=Aestuariibacter salexigens TaxID=226010 RepID=UPI000425B20F|nr:mechanosensitive ion channel domain-containing protein [Aestuariibacter salexigens]
MERIRTVLDTPLFTAIDHTFTLGDILIVPAAILLGLLVVKFLARLLTRGLVARGADANLVHLIKRIFYVIGLIIIAVTTLDLLNVPITAFAFLSGAVAIGFGFGAQNIINNFISGWILMWERPIRIGDFLEVDGARGTVETVNTRSTRIRRVDGVHLLIPNSKLLENTVVNWTLMDRLTRTSVRVGVAYGSPCMQVAALIEQAAKQHDAILNDPEPIVIFDDFGDNALAFEVFFWVNASKERDLRKIRSDVRFSIDELFSQAGIVIAFPQRDVHVDGQLTVVNAKPPKQ